MAAAASAARPSAEPAEDVQAFDLSDGELAGLAKERAAHMQRLAAIWQANDTPAPIVMRAMRRVARRHRITLPCKPGLTSAINRMTHPAWWRRQLRTRLRHVEHAAIGAGQVHGHAAPYLSPRAERRFERDRTRNAELLASMEAINQVTGEVIALDELAENSLANPANRRKALAVRIKGVEKHAAAAGLEALFLTITCPSRMHPRHSKTGARNARHDGTSPRQAQAYLCKVWSSAIRKLQHDGIAAFGLRVVEPHKDACPHWHALVFVAPEMAYTLVETFRSYAFRESPNEPGAAEHRFKVERIDPARGSALGYVLKYVSKSIDGEGVDIDHESGKSGTDAARAIVGWARLWGIRQFQFFGLPAITPTRELFRCEREGLPSEALRQAHDATKANDYAAYLDALQSFALRFSVDYSERPSARYPGETARRILGLSAGAVDLLTIAHLVTRTDEWRIQPRGADALSAVDATPWTRFNNSAPVDSIEVFDAAAASPERPVIRGPDRRRRRRPIGSSSRPTVPITPL
ncbi:hypothetical protein BH11PSE9_BH11PSE9_21070 [soil metagenome]